MNPIDTTASFWLPGKFSTMAPDIDGLFYFIYWCSVFLFVLVVTAMTFFAVRYRRRGKVGLTSNFVHNTPMEILWSVIPAIPIVVVFIWGSRDFVRLHTMPGNAVEVKVTAQKWFWTFDYPEGANSVNELVVPVSKPVKLTMSSQDVIHSLFVPGFRVKQDILPNRYTQLWFEPVAIGSFDLYCAEFCGKGHSEMIAKVKVVSDSEFVKWQDAQNKPPEGMALADWGGLLIKQKGCATCHSIDGSTNTCPTLKGVFGHEVLMTDGSRVVADENYVRESILDPRAKVVNGFQPVMPTYQGVIKDRHIDAIIEYLKTLAK